MLLFRQDDVKGGAGPFLGGSADASVMVLYDLFADRQSDARSFEFGSAV